MPSLSEYVYFKTNAVPHQLEGKAVCLGLNLRIAKKELESISSMDALKKALSNEMGKYHIAFKINAILINNEPLVHIEQLKMASSGADLKINIRLLSADERLAIDNMKKMYAELVDKKAAQNGYQKEIDVLLQKIQILQHKKENSGKEIALIVQKFSDLTEQMQHLLPPALSKSKTASTASSGLFSSKVHEGSAVNHRKKVLPVELIL